MTSSKALVPVIDELLSTVAGLWPDGSDVRLSDRRHSSRDAVSFLVVPTLERPRILVPTNHRAAASRALRRYSTALPRRDVATRLAGSAALRIVGDRLLDTRVEVTGGDETSLQSYLSSVLGEPVVFSVWIGARVADRKGGESRKRGNSKPVLQVFDRKGRSLAFVKLATTAFSRGLVQAEADALRMLAGVELPDTLEVPSVLHSGYWNQMPVLVASALEPGPVQPRGVPASAMMAIASAFGDERRSLTETAFWAGLTAARDALVDTGRQTRLGAAMAALADQAGGHEFPKGAWHGDWTSWNMARRGGRVLVWDWERFEVDAPRGLDIVHNLVHEACRSTGLRAGSVRTGLRHALQMDLSGGLPPRVLATSYLAAATARAAYAAQEGRGFTAEPTAVVMLDVLEQWLREPA